MYYYFNELSLKTNQPLTGSGTLLAEFALLNSMLRRALRAKLCVEENFLSQLLNYQLGEKYYVRDWLNDKRADVDDRNRFRALWGSSSDIEMPLISEKDALTLAEIDNSIFELPDDLRRFTLGRSGFGIAVVTNGFVVSLRTDPFWEQSMLMIKRLQVGATDVWEETIYQQPHASQTAHIGLHQNFLEENSVQRFFAHNNFVLQHFPNLEATGNLDDCRDLDGFLTRCRKAKENERRGAYIQLGKQVATLNGYQLCTFDTRNLNRDDQGRPRDIYFAGERGKTIYLSIDLLHGEFEVFNSSGMHIGVALLNGQPSKKVAVKGRFLVLE